MSTNEKAVIITEAGYNSMKKELEYLKTVKRHEVADRIKIAREFGDLSENAEYDEAKNEQGFVEGRISEIERKLKVIQVIDDKDIHTEDVGVGSIVKIKNSAFDKISEFKIVGSQESDPKNNRISNESPIGSALLGAKVGETVKVQIPDGEAAYQILEIHR
ncbi:transcription elongation factor GreA [Acetobacterium paludosum]|uniref:Transcription elongation factor GreA n=1 Tax=Acetobacterium paludosum TaxID=52693 RepID=A0A923HZ94_9FIRM|nr:transcription elongation factor GreA [Acetobacterium paludosum]MBC3889887.1 transcription elongation factor GreA [Acetobacterium paludosum]